MLNELDTEELMTLLRGIKTLREQIKDKELPTCEDLDKYHTLVDCLVHFLFTKFGERKQEREKISLGKLIKVDSGYSIYETTMFGIFVFILCEGNRVISTHHSYAGAYTACKQLLSKNKQRGG